MQDFGWTLQGLKLILPEVVVAGGVVLVVVFDLFPRLSKTALMIFAWIVLAAALVLAAHDWLHLKEPVGVFNPESASKPNLGSAAHDGYGLFFKTLFLSFGLLTVLFSWPQVRRWPSGQGEFLALLLSCLFGMLIMATASDLLMMFLALEFVSVTSYILTGLLRRNRRSAEASLKYILYGAAAGGVMLFGMSFLYGLTGEVNVVAIGEALQKKQVPAMLALIISVMISGGFAYKIAAAPFHMWCPDVYEGAPTPVTAFFSIGPKLAGFAMLGRFLEGVFPGGPALPAFEWRIVIATLALLTMAIGNFTALWQNNLKRLLAYSGIAHAGYMLLVFLVAADENVASLLFYAVAYLFMNLGAFLVVLILEDKYGVETVSECRGLGWTDPWLCVMMALFMFSLTGLPPLAGFVGKWLLFGHVVKHAVAAPQGWDWLSISMVVAAVLFSVVSLCYYARVIGVMFLGQTEAPPVAQQRTPLWSGMTWVMAAGTVGLIFFTKPVWKLCEAAASSLVR